jgi:hypothetical protein
MTPWLQAHCESMKWMSLLADARYSLLFLHDRIIYVFLFSRSGKQRDKSLMS